MADIIAPAHDVDSKPSTAAQISEARQPAGRGTSDIIIRQLVALNNKLDTILEKVEKLNAVCGATSRLEVRLVELEAGRQNYSCFLAGMDWKVVRVAERNTDPPYRISSHAVLDALSLAELRETCEYYGFPPNPHSTADRLRAIVAYEVGVPLHPFPPPPGPPPSAYLMPVNQAAAAPRPVANEQAKADPHVEVHPRRSARLRAQR